MPDPTPVPPVNPPAPAPPVVVTQPSVTPMQVFGINLASNALTLALAGMMFFKGCSPTPNPFVPPPNPPVTPPVTPPNPTPPSTPLTRALSTYLASEPASWVAVEAGLKSGQITTAKGVTDQFATTSKPLFDALSTALSQHCDSTGKITDPAGLAAMIGDAGRSNGGK